MLSLKPDDQSGGHTHTVAFERPAGALRPGTTLNTGAAGVAVVTYVAPRPGGLVDLTGRSGDADSASVTIMVAVPGLTLLLPGAHYELIGATTAHPTNHYGTPGFVSALQQLADSLYAKHGAKLEFNEMSLEFGGVFDLQQQWDRPHAEHRLGTNCDMRTSGRTETELRFARGKWEELGGTVHDETDTSSPHYHLRYQRTDADAHPRSLIAHA